MKRKNRFLYLVIPVVNSFLIAIIPDYYFWCLVMLFIGATVFFAVIVIDIFGKTSNWKNALILFGLGVASYILGILLVLARNHFLH
jgi:hypothetical protein